MYQMKEQDKTQGKQLNEVEIGNLPEKEFRMMIVKMIQDLRKRMEAKIKKMPEMFNKDLEELKNTRSWQPVELSLQTQRFRQNEMAEEYFPDKGTR